MKFTKMEGCGNDYVYINCFEEEVVCPEKLAIAMSERHFGVGSDGLVLIMPSKIADCRMRMFNIDGSEGNMCGNATCCIGKYVYDRGIFEKQELTLETKTGIRCLQLHVEDKQVTKVTVDMGEPILTPREIPVTHKESPVIQKKIVSQNREFLFTCVSMGNPHAVAFIDNVDEFLVEHYGKPIEENFLFPDKVNVEFIEIVDRSHLKMRVWERGSGETMACGTGACASVVAAILNGYCERRVSVALLGGTLEIMWDEKDNHVYMTGFGKFSFDGMWLR